MTTFVSLGTNRVHAQRRLDKSPTSVLTPISPLAPSPSLNAKLSNESSQHGHETVPPVKPWGPPKLECFGDYRQEEWLEKHIGGPLYAQQDCLPELTLPTVHETLERFLPSALPLANEDDAEQVALLQAVESFPSQTKLLQKRLRKRQAEEYVASSYLQHWWNCSTYLQVRDPVVINSSYYFQFTDDTTIYTSDGNPQIRRAAALLFSTALVRLQIATGSLTPETVGRGTAAQPLCSTAYKYMFHACRVPNLSHDSYVIYDPALHHHAAVAVRGHLFQVPLVDPLTHQPVSMLTLEKSLEWCVSQAEAAGSGSITNELTWLTSQNRDDWARVYNKLSAIPTWQKSLRILESSACLICLDEACAYTRQDMAHLLLHGIPMTSQPETIVLNRWFDKSIQFIVSANGKAGLIGEHSMMDGMPVSRVAERIASVSYKDCWESMNEESSSKSLSSQVEPFASFIFAPECVPPPSICASIQVARAQHWDAVERHEIQTKRFGVYGSDWIKQHAKLSPDAFVQMAMQIATYRLWDGQQGGTYEATHTRAFRHGRTETVRTVSPQSAALVKRFGRYPLLHEIQDPHSRTEKLALLREAVTAHTAFVKAAMQGKGVDRHFFALQQAKMELDGLDGCDGRNGLEDSHWNLPTLFSNATFQKSSTWRVSTSNLSLPHMENWGYGQVTPEGVGLSYSIQPNHLSFSVTALREHHWADRLCHHLVEALMELQLLIVERSDERSHKRTALASEWSVTIRR